jgi:GGDEF domain-containing protein
MDTTAKAERKAAAMLLEGIAASQVVLDLAAARNFRSAILRSPLNLPELLPEQELTTEVKNVVREFERYRTAIELTLKERHNEWRLTVSQLAHLLAGYNRIDQSSDKWTGICVQLTSATAAEEIEAMRQKLMQLFQSLETQSATRRAIEVGKQDMSKANHNAAGLRGGGAAIEQVQRLMTEGKVFCVGIFRLNCLDVVGERFGQEGIQDCLMAVAAFLTQNLSSDDSIYHWSESSLVVLCERRIREDMLNAEWNRVLARNRDFTIRIGGRNIMLRIPIALELIPVSQLNSADDLQRLLAEPDLSRSWGVGLNSPPVASVLGGRGDCVVKL